MAQTDSNRYTKHSIAFSIRNEGKINQLQYLSFFTSIIVFPISFVNALSLTVNQS